MAFDKYEYGIFHKIKNRGWGKNSIKMYTHEFSERVSCNSKQNYVKIVLQVSS